MKINFKVWAVIAVTLCVILFGYAAMHFQHPKAAKKRNAVVSLTNSSVFSNPLKTHNGEIEVYSYLPLNATEPFEALAEALKVKKDSTRFRVMWSNVTPGGPMDGTMIYDKNRRLIKEYDEVWFHGTYARFEYLITKVSDEDIMRYIKEYAKWPRPVRIEFHSFISIFRSYGCKTYRLGRKFKGSSYTKAKPWWPDDAADITKHPSKSTSQ
jgi:hypothetical protein